MRLLDLFSGAGGAAVGYYRAGFTEIVGIDNQPMPRYPFKFILGDALEYVREHGHEFDAIHASPPCQDYSVTKSKHKHKVYPRLIGDVRCALVKTGKPWVIENVVGARSDIKTTIELCGKSFGLKVYRHRLFESSVLIPNIYHYPHKDKTPGMGMGVSPNGFISINRGGVRGMRAGDIMRLMSDAMGIDWMTRAELSEAIPPAYTEYIGRYLIVACRERA